MKVVVKRKLPANYDERDKVFFQREFVKAMEEPSSLTIRNAFITSQGVVYTGWRIVKASLVPDIPNDLNVSHLIAQMIKKSKIKWMGRKIPSVVFDYWYKGYFHWMTEVLPRILYLKKFGSDFIPVVPDATDAPFIRKTLLPFDFKEYVWIKPDEYLFARKALLVRHTAPTGNYNEDLIRELRTLFRKYFVSAITAYPVDKIYISRLRTSRRRVINEEAISALLGEYGFLTLYFEDYSFEEQVRLAANAGMLISIHGAGLTNMLFMKAQTSILEFRPKDDDTNLCYYALASALDLNYYYQFGEPEQKAKSIHDDLYIDVVKLRENVERMLSQP